MENSELSVREMVEHVWRYFALHSAQRISVFNFFLILSGLVAAGMAACLQRSGRFQLLGMGFGLLLALVSFVFWKLDQRTAFLIKHAEMALVDLEQSMPVERARLFTLEPKLTKSYLDRRLFLRPWTYGMTFRFIFVVMALAGIVGAVLCAWYPLGS